MSSRLLCTRPQLRPARALLTPTWLVALALLGINDHLLKGAGILPGALTGKLSDIAGMIVAPTLLAALLGLRSRRGLLACHVAVGAVFAAIKVSPAAADAWSWLMGLAGNAWTITVDPTDLLVLPALAIGWHALMPAMSRPSRPIPAMPRLQPLVPRLAQLTAIVAGTTLSVATSPRQHESEESGPETGWDEVGEGEAEFGGTDTDDINYMDIEADVYLNNGSDADIIIRTRELRPEILLDCIALQDDPGLLFSEAVFGAGLTYTMPPRTNAAVRDLATSQDRDCYAVRIEGDNLREPFILFWTRSAIPVQFIVGDIRDPSEHTSGAVILGADTDGKLSVTSSQREIVFEIPAFPPVDAFYPGADVERLAWSDPPTTSQPLQLTTLDLGPDGCLGLEFNDGAALPRWYLCLPANSFPFAQGDWLTVESFQNGDVLQLSRVAGPMDPEAPPAVAMVIAHGRGLPKLADTVMAGKAIYNASIAPDPVCGTVARPSQISVRYEDAAPQTARAGDILELQGADTTLTVRVVHAEERILLDTVCAEGPDDLGADLEIVAVRAPSAP